MFIIHGIGQSNHDPNFLSWTTSRELPRVLLLYPSMVNNMLPGTFKGLGDMSTLVTCTGLDVGAMNETKIRLVIFTPATHSNIQSEKIDGVERVYPNDWIVNFFSNYFLQTLTCKYMFNVKFSITFQFYPGKLAWCESDMSVCVFHIGECT